MNIIELEDQILSLPSQARALLAERILESLDSSEESRVHSLWVTEVTKRLEDWRAGRVQLLTGKEAVEYLSHA